MAVGILCYSECIVETVQDGSWQLMKFGTIANAKLFTWNSDFGDSGYDYKMEARRNTKETKDTITVTGSWSPDDKNTP